MLPGAARQQPAHAGRSPLRRLVPLVCLLLAGCADAQFLRRTCPSPNDPRAAADAPAPDVAYRVGWPDARLIRGTLADIRDQVKAAGITRTALILVGRALAGEGSDSRLYAADHHHLMRPLVRTRS